MKEVTVTHDKEGEKLEVPIEFVLIPAPTGFRYRLTPIFIKDDFPYGYDGPNNVGEVKPFYLARYLHHSPDRFPTVYVDYNDTEQVASSIGGRLPTEYEWEWAAYGGEDWEFAGCTDVNKVAWTNQTCAWEQRVGILKPNGYGLFDMSGLVYEWTSTPVDWERIIKDGGSNRVVRGGYWNNDARVARVAYRGGDVPSDRNVYLGFRVAMDVSKMNEALQSGRAGKSTPRIYVAPHDVQALGFPW